MAGFQINFQDYRRLSEQLLESQVAIGEPWNKLPEEAYWKDMHN
jgi:hypothetical protein